MAQPAWTSPRRLKNLLAEAVQSRRRTLSTSPSSSPPMPNPGNGASSSTAHNKRSTLPGDSVSEVSHSFVSQYEATDWEDKQRGRRMLAGWYAEAKTGRSEREVSRLVERTEKLEAARKQQAKQAATQVDRLSEEVQRMRESAARRRSAGGAIAAGSGAAGVSRGAQTSQQTRESTGAQTQSTITVASAQTQSAPATQDGAFQTTAAVGVGIGIGTGAGDQDGDGLQAHAAVLAAPGPGPAPEIDTGSTHSAVPDGGSPTSPSTAAQALEAALLRCSHLVPQGDWQLERALESARDAAHELEIEEAERCRARIFAEEAQALAAESVRTLERAVAESKEAQDNSARSLADALALGQQMEEELREQRRIQEGFERERTKLLLELNELRQGHARTSTALDDSLGASAVLEAEVEDSRLRQREAEEALREALATIATLEVEILKSHQAQRAAEDALSVSKSGEEKLKEHLRSALDQACSAEPNPALQQIAPDDCDPKVCSAHSLQAATVRASMSDDGRNPSVLPRQDGEAETRMLQLEEELLASQQKLAEMASKVRQLQLESWDGGSDQEKSGETEQVWQQRCAELEKDLCALEFERNEARAALETRELEWKEELQRSRKELADMEEDFKRSGARLNSLEEALSSPRKMVVRAVEGGFGASRRNADRSKEEVPETQLISTAGSGGRTANANASHFSESPATPGARWSPEHRTVRGLEESLGHAAAEVEVLRQRTERAERDKLELSNQVSSLATEREELLLKIEAAKLAGQHRASQDAKQRAVFEAEASQRENLACERAKAAADDAEEAKRLHEQAEMERKRLISDVERLEIVARDLETRASGAETHLNTLQVKCTETEARAVLAESLVVRLETGAMAHEAEMFECQKRIQSLQEEAEKLPVLEREINRLHGEAASAMTQLRDAKEETAVIRDGLQRDLEAALEKQQRSEAQRQEVSCHAAVQIAELQQKVNEYEASEAAATRAREQQTTRRLSSWADSLSVRERIAELESKTDREGTLLRQGSTGSEVAGGRRLAELERRVAEAEERETSSERAHAQDLARAQEGLAAAIAAAGAAAYVGPEGALEETVRLRRELVQLQQDLKQRGDGTRFSGDPVEMSTIQDSDGIREWAAELRGMLLRMEACLNGTEDEFEEEPVVQVDFSGGWQAVVSTAAAALRRQIQTTGEDQARAATAAQALRKQNDTLARELQAERIRARGRNSARAGGNTTPQDGSSAHCSECGLVSSMEVDLSLLQDQHDTLAREHQIAVDKALAAEKSRAAAVSALARSQQALVQEKEKEFSAQRSNDVEEQVHEKQPQCSDVEAAFEQLQGRYDKLKEEHVESKALSEQNITLLSDMLNETQSELVLLHQERQRWREMEFSRRESAASSLQGGRRSSGLR